ncbi:hypothetical protein M501DRAFT_985761 [Patellaria atrata CBS 101060]|uniref:N-acetyltransferase domain-containing protein n=1 Tax=Patellaria atrata CBS 101060 TaxID=1346257 RepID=A0A9P4VVK3_9PEZI|nr:hypothetical protein M501DRAFT_985761 [Patellaria atrata CBS 101060]
MDVSNSENSKFVSQERQGRPGDNIPSQAQAAAASKQTSFAHDGGAPIPSHQDTDLLSTSNPIIITQNPIDIISTQTAASTEPNTMARNGKCKPKANPRSDKWPTNKEIREHAEKAGNEGDKTAKSSADDAYYDETNPLGHLVDWNGDWLPAPVDWEFRNTYKSKNFFRNIADWIPDKDRDERVTTEQLLDPVKGEVVVRKWIPTDIDAEDTQLWWDRHLQSDLYLDSLDLDEENQFDKPWWTMFTPQNSSMLKPINVPDAKLDPVDEISCKLAAADLGSRHASKKITLKEERRKAWKKAYYDSFKNARELKVELDKLQLDPRATQVKPFVNIYLREYKPGDATQVVDIYNWYIRNSVFAPEFQVRPINVMASSLQALKDAGLTFIVAVEKKISTGPNNRRPRGPEKIVGYAYTNEFPREHPMFRYTAEMELFVHPEYLKKGVARCLLDRLLYLVDPMYDLRNGYEFVGEGTHLCAGGKRVLNSIIAFLHYDDNDVFWADCITEWMNGFGFELEADVKKVGSKLGKFVGYRILHYRTGVNMPAHAP